METPELASAFLAKYEDEMAKYQAYMSRRQGKTPRIVRVGYPSQRIKAPHNPSQDLGY